MLERLTDTWGKLKDNFKSNKEARLRVWQTFCEETPLQGFLFFRKSQLSYEKAMWLLLVALAIALTLNDTIKTISDYKNEEVLSKVSFVRDETITFQRPLVLIYFKFTNSAGNLELQNGNLTQQFLEANRMKIISYYTTVAYRLNSANNTEDFEGFFSSNEPQQILVPVLRLAVELFYILNDRQLESDQSNTINATLDYANRSNEHQSSVIHLRRFFKCNKLHLLHAYKTTGMYLCMLLDLKMITNPGGYANDVCLRRNVVIINDGQVAIRLPRAINFTSPTDAAAIHANSRLPNAIQIARFLALFGAESIYTLENGFFVVEHELPVVDIEVTSVKSYSTRDAPCSNKGNSEDHAYCYNQCLSDFNQDRCGCRMLNQSVLYNKPYVAKDDICFDRHNSSDTESIRLAIQQQCLTDLAATPSVTKDCEAQCPKPCSNVHLRFSRLHLVGEQDRKRLNDSSTTVTFFVFGHSHLYIEQSLAMDAQSFISNLGGNLSLYIGGTFFAVIHITTCIYRLAVSLIVAKNEEETRETAKQQEFEQLSTESEIQSLKSQVAERNETIDRLVQDVRLLKGMISQNGTQNNI